MFGIGFSELVLILVVALVIFGPDKLPEVGKTMGKTIKEFKAAVNKIDSEIKKEVNDVAQATGMDETLKDLKQAEQSLKDIDKNLKDISKINPLKNEMDDLSQDLKKAENAMKGFDKELKDINKIDPLKTNDTAE